jgi:hypothetical protein
MPRAHVPRAIAALLTLAVWSALAALGPRSAIDQRLAPVRPAAAAPGPSCWWDRIPELTISTRPDDAGIRLVHDGVAFWNRLLAEIGTPFKLGPIAETSQALPDDYLARLSDSIVGPPRQNPLDDPGELRQLPGDLIVALSATPLVSFSTCPRPGRRVLVGIRTDRIPPLSLPNVARNVIAHELGHAIGLGHNSDPRMLMCGRPAPCRPNEFVSQTERYFPVADAEKAYLLQLYPSSWKPSR